MTSAHNPAPSSTRGVKLKRHVGPIGLLFAAIGSIIGSGWLFGAYNASIIAGPVAIFSWLIAGLMIMLIGLCYAELGPMFPISGGVIRFPHFAWGSFASYSLGFITWIATAAVPAIEVEGTLTYATRYAPLTTRETANGVTVHVLTPLGIVVAVILLALFVVLNYFGVRLFAQINNVLVWWKLFVIILVIVVFLITAFATVNMGTTANFTSHGFAPNGWAAVFTCISTAGITFSYLGFRQGIELAGETTNPKRNIPLAIIGSIGITAIIYALLQIAFTMAIPGGVLAKSGSWAGLVFTNDAGPLAALATLGGLAWLAYILYFDAIISPLDTGFIYTTIGARVSYAMGRNGNSPRFLSVNNKHGVPHWSLLVTFVVGVILLLPFPSWQQLVGFITSATVLSFGSGPIVVALMRRQFPNRHRPFKLPGGDLIPWLAFYSANMIIFWAGWDTNYKLFITILIGYVALVIFELTGKLRKPALDFKVGAAWVIPYLVAMTLFSWLMDPNTHPALFGWAFLVNIVITGGIFILAVRVHLPKAQMEAYMADSEGESEDDALEQSHLAGDAII
ncbi:APC family permease [Homoserinimonas sp. OAct 916]|uniref:APC family permease n=1 Tax=Homoserinimonas sp. OAct 916 TaxID=2211450 RepID=UPI000DBE153C|nr:APC family permease [Homoserinimonas sp. OAct 916]